MRPIRTLTIFLAAALILSACGLIPSSSSSTGGVPRPTGSPVSSEPTLLPTLAISPTPTSSITVEPSALNGLGLLVWHAFAGEADQVFTEQVARFNAANEWGVTVEATGYGDYPALFDAVSAALDTAQAPGLVVALPEQTLTWDASSAVMDLSPYLTDPIWGLGSAALADIPGVFLAQDNVDGKQLGMPAQRSARFLFYNRTWAEELGFGQPPATADEFRRQACAANAAMRADSDVSNDFKGGWVVDTHWQTLYSWLLAFGGNVTQEAGYQFNNDQELATLQFLKKMNDDHCAWLGETPYDSFAVRSALFVTGDLAEVPQVSEAMSRLESSDEWTVIPFPGTQGSDVVTYGPSYSVLKSTPEEQLAAWLFAGWLLSPENQAQWVEATGLFPLRASAMDMVAQYRAVSPQWDAAVGELSLARNVPQLASWREARYILSDGMTAIFQADTPLEQIPTILEEMDALAEDISKK